MRQYLVKKCKSLKLNSSKPYTEEFTVFINVKIDNLKELSKSMPLIVNKALKNNKEIIKIIIDKKYL
tara:strand:+ start:79 stop:279 length:201 start_codon:yes stop_codon:yes gene_type:complete